MISAIIPHAYGLANVDEALEQCVNSLHGYADELIIVANDSIGFAKAVNLGCRLSKGDFLVIINNDTRVVSGTLADMPLRGYVTVPKTNPEPRDELPRAFYCIPRELYQRISDEFGYYLDENFQMGYFEDDDLIRRMELLNIPCKTIESVIIEHLNGGGLTMKQIGEQKYFDRNQAVFNSKWKATH